MATVQIPDFLKIKHSCMGMLDPGVYREIYHAAQRSSKDVIEVGTFRGASAISSALGLAPGLMVHTVDHYADQRFTGDTASEVRATFAQYGVADRIKAYVGKSVALAEALPADQTFGMCILDADGALDRDFRLFYDRLEPGAAVVIDDYAPEKAVLTYNSDGTVTFFQKHRLTALLVDYFERCGLIERDRVLKETYFGRKTGLKQFDDAVDLRDLIDIYRKLSYGTVNPPNRYLEATRLALHRRAPKTYMALKRLAGRAAM